MHNEVRELYNQEVREFYNQYAEREWERLDIDVYSRIIFIQHMDFIHEYIKSGMSILDAGCGAGRYSVELAKMGCKVTLFDISDEQLKIAKDKMNEFQLNDNVSEYVQGDIADLSSFSDNTFDMVVCYGAPLSYILDERDIVISEFLRVLKKGGVVAASVNSKWGILRDLIGRQFQDFFNNPDYWFIDTVITTGDCPKHEKVSQPAGHFFQSDELKHLFKKSGFKETLLAASPCIICGSRKEANELCKDETAYKTILDIEMKAYQNRALTDAGEFLLIRGIK